MQIKSLGFRGVTLTDKEDKVRLNNVDFDFPLNTVTLIEGAPHSGKTLLLCALAGLIRPEHGVYQINGRDVSRLNFNKFNEYRKNIGFVFEQGGLLTNKTLRENLLLPLTYHGVFANKDANRKVDRLLDYLGLRDVQHYRPTNLSSSYACMGNFARAVVLDPNILLLDRPTTGLIRNDAQIILDYIKEERSKGRFEHVFISTEQQFVIKQLISDRITIEDMRLHHPD